MKKLLFVLLLIALSSWPNTVQAVTVPSTKGLTVSPALEQLSLSQGQDSASFDATVSDNTNQPMGIEISSADFTYLDLKGNVNFLSGQAAVNNRHGLASSLKISPNQLNLKPGQSQTVNVSLSNANLLATGGHYGALIYRYLGPTVQPSNMVNINQAVTTLIFLTTAGQGTQILKLDTPLLGSLQTALPDSLNTVFENSGNTQTVLRGYIELLSPSSKVLASGIINEGSGLMLPDSKRLFTVNLGLQTKEYLWPGIYHLKVNYRHDGQSSFMTYEENFLYISLIQILIVLAAIFVIAGLFILLWHQLSHRPRYRR